MEKILLAIIIVLIIVLVYTDIKFSKSGKEGFLNIFQDNAIFPGMTLEDLKPIDYSYTFNPIEKIPATLEHELDYNPDVKFISNYGNLEEMDSLKKNSIPYKPMDASKLYEKKVSSI